MKTAQYLTILCFISLFQLSVASEELRAQKDKSCITGLVIKCVNTAVTTFAKLPLNMAIPKNCSQTKDYVAIMKRSRKKRKNSDKPIKTSYLPKIKTVISVGFATALVYGGYRLYQWCSFYTPKNLKDDFENLAKDQTEKLTQLMDVFKKTNADKKSFFQQKLTAWEEESKELLKQNNQEIDTIVSINEQLITETQAQNENLSLIKNTLIKEMNNLNNNIKTIDLIQEKQLKIEKEITGSIEEARVYNTEIELKLKTLESSHENLAGQGRKHTAISNNDFNTIENFFKKLKELK